MSELRKDPIVDRWVLMAKNRADRPNQFDAAQDLPTVDECPFCEGNERWTPAEVLAFRGPGGKKDGPGWSVRVVPNKFPAIGKGDGTVDGTGDSATDPASGIYVSQPGVGGHEVIIEAPQHVALTGNLTEENLADVLRIYRDRLVHWKNSTPQLVYGLVFKNVGPAAGATIEHLHSQLIVLPFLPSTVREQLDASREYHRIHGQCIYCQLIRQESDAARRVVVETPELLAICPFASRFSYETWIVPRRHASHFDQIRDEDIPALAATTKRILAKIESVLPKPAYNWILRTAPFDSEPLQHYHWHIEILPRLAIPAGFEWATGCAINPVDPDEAAAALREA